MNTYTTSLGRDRENSLVSAGDHHLGDDDLFSAEDNAILASNSDNGAINTIQNDLASLTKF